jgi:hypothetical protein
MDTEKTLYKLINPEFSFEFGGRVFEVRKANLDKAIKYQKKHKEVLDKTGSILELIPYCIYLILVDKDPTITEEWVRENTPADIDAIECLITLGFLSQKKREAVKKMEEIVEKKLTTESSLH